MEKIRSTIELIWDHPILDEGFTAIPNVLLKNMGRLGVTDRELHFIVQLASFKFSAQSEIRPSYRTLAERMGKHHINLRKIAASLEKKGLMKRIFRKSANGDFETTIFDLSPLLNQLFPKGEGGKSDNANTPYNENANPPHSDNANTPYSDNASRIKQVSINKTTSEKERSKLSPDIVKALKEKGLSEGQIVLVSVTRPSITNREIQDTWKWIQKWKRFNNKEATFYTALVENWEKPQRRTTGIV